MRGQKVALHEAKTRGSFTRTVNSVDWNAKHSAKLENNFLATLERLQNVGKKLEEWLRQEALSQEYLPKTSTFEGVGESNPNSENNTSLNYMPDSLTAIRGKISHGLSLEFQQKYEQLNQDKFKGYGVRLDQDANGENSIPPKKTISDMSDSLTSIREIMSHGLSPEFRLPREEPLRCEIN